MRICILVGPIILAAAFLAAQSRYETGPYQGFVRENPETMMVEIARPLKVAAIKGRIVSPSNSPLPETYFEVRDSKGHVFSTQSDASGNFQMPNVTAGTYRFKVTKDLFKSTVGTIVVSPRIKTTTIQIKLYPGT